MNAFGADVTILEYMSDILPIFDKDIMKRLAMFLKKKGIKIQTEVKVNQVEKCDGGLSVLTESKKGEADYECDAVLVATGRKINIEGLNLGGIGIKYHPSGIWVDEKFSTNIPGIYAVGDVIGGQMLAHVASGEGKAAVENMMGLKGYINYSVVPNCVFTFPEVACVGMTEEEINLKGISAVTSKFMFGANGKALTMGEEEGFVKIIADKNTKKIIGVHIMGPHACDLIHEAALAMENDLTVHEISRTIHAHPTLSEAFIEAVEGIDGRAIHIAPSRLKRSV